MLLQRRKVVIELTEDMLGTVPKDPEVYKTYIESKKPPELMSEDESATVPDNSETKGWTGFHSDDEGLFVYDYFIKGFLKNAGNILKVQLGKKNLKSKINDNLFVLPRKIHLGKTEPDGDPLERPLRAMTAQGPRVTLARSDKLDAGLRIEFEIQFLKHPDIGDKVIKEILSYGQLMGLGHIRNGGYGRFKVKSYKKIDDE